MSNRTMKYKTLRSHSTSKAMGARWAAISRIRDALWERHGLTVKPGQDEAKIREGYEMRQSDMMTIKGENVITVELWKRVDVETTVLNVTVQEVKVDEKNKLEDLLK